MPFVTNAPANLPSAQATPNPVSILVGPANRAPSIDITHKVDLTTLRIEETGNHEHASMDLTIWDKQLLYTAMRGEWKIMVTIGQGSNNALFRGYIRQPRAEALAVYSQYNASAEDVGTLLDKMVVGEQGSSRPAHESDKQRISWLFGNSHYTTALTNSAYGWGGAVDLSKVQVLNSDLDAQTFPGGMTIRQALEKILGLASDSANYYFDMNLRLHTFDGSNPEAGVSSPYDISDVPQPGAGKVAGEALSVDWDSGALFNAYWVKAASVKYNAYYTDEAPFLALGTGSLPGPSSVSIYGERAKVLSAPDADSDKKAQRVVKAALRDTRNPIPRITFSVAGDSVTNGAARWQGGQTVYINDDARGLNGSGTDAGPWAGSHDEPLQPFRIVRVTTTFVNGKGDRRIEIEAGGRRAHLFGGGN